MFCLSTVSKMVVVILFVARYHALVFSQSELLWSIVCEGGQIWVYVNRRNLRTPKAAFVALRTEYSCAEKYGETQDTNRFLFRETFQPEPVNLKPCRLLHYASS